MSSTIIIFLCYAMRDLPLAKRLRRHLQMLQRQSPIDMYDRNIDEGMEWERQIDNRLNSAHIILLLVSPDFLNSDYCYSIEMERAILRHEHGEARVIPIILRPVYWEKTPFAKLQVLPEDAKPLTSWRDIDGAFFDLTRSIYKVVQELGV